MGRMPKHLLMKTLNLKPELNLETNSNHMRTHSKTRSTIRKNWEPKSVTKTKKIEEAVNEKIAWLEENQEADGEDFKKQKKELEDAVQPIIAKLYQQGGAPPPGGEEGEDETDKDEL